MWSGFNRLEYMTRSLHSDCMPREHKLSFRRFGDVSFFNLIISVRKNADFWDVAPCRSCVNRRFGGTYRLHLQTISYSETSVHTRSTLRHIPEDGILHSHRRENVKSYTVSVQFTLIRNTSAYEYVLQCRI
jgi:hypothetical protein